MKEPVNYGMQMHRLMYSYSHWRKWGESGPPLNKPLRHIPPKSRPTDLKFRRSPDLYLPWVNDSWGENRSKDVQRFKGVFR